ncbi:MAG: multidrug transporter [Desulfuromonas sp.]|nr:MAG: multidrug transporter [Desulfuromonas sp.]
MKKFLMAGLLMALLALSGCASMAPDYQRPAAPVPGTWPTAAATDNATSAAELPWREFFTDAQLRQVIELALENNRDLRVAALNIERAQAQYQIREATLVPQVSATGAGSGQRTPADLSSSGSAIVSHRYSVGLGVSSYELDLFGRVRSLKDQALAQYLATEEARRSVQIGLVAETALGYLTLAADREHLAIARATLASRQSSFDLSERRYAAGAASALDLNQARSGVEAAQVEIARYEGQVAQDINALNLVVGSTLPDDLLAPDWATLRQSLHNLSPGLPSDVLLNRPDILQAEQLLQAANANIGAARAAFFPRITLTGSLGTASAELSGLFKGGSGTWSFAPQVSVPIFDAGTNKANLKVAETDREIALAQYEKAIQSAFSNVANALVNRDTIRRQLDAQMALTSTTAESYQLAQVRFDKGIDSYLVVLDSQRALYSARQNLVTTDYARVSNLTTLYRVLGGGWDETPE